MKLKYGLRAQQRRLERAESMTLFSAPLASVAQLIEEPHARATDPGTSHEAAARARAGNGLLIRTIRSVVELSDTPLSAFDIAAKVGKVMPGRWQQDTVRSAVARSGLRCVDVEGLSPSRQRCARYTVDSL